MGKRFLENLRKWIEDIENSKLPLGYFILTFFSALVIRMFLESFSSPYVLNLYSLLHFVVFYSALAIALIIFLHVVTKIKVEKVSRIILLSFLVIISVPILDLIISGGKGYVLAYLLPGVHDNLLLRYLTLGGEFSELGLTYGIKIELFLESKKKDYGLVLCKPHSWDKNIYVHNT